MKINLYNENSLLDMIKNIATPFFIQDKDWDGSVVFRVDDCHDQNVTGQYFYYTDFYSEDSLPEINVDGLYHLVPRAALIDMGLTDEDIEGHSDDVEMDFMSDSLSEEYNTDLVSEEQSHTDEILYAIDTIITRKTAYLEDPSSVIVGNPEVHGRAFQTNPGMEEKNRINSSNSLLLDDIDQLRHAQHSPYVRHLKLKFDDNDFYEDIFVGQNLVFDNGKTYVAAWQSPLGNLAYSDETEYVHNNTRAELESKREVSIRSGIVNDVIETYRKAGTTSADSLVYDRFLLKILKEKRTHKELTNIIPTIQKNQNKIIRAKEKENFVVQGCAGSGKTMILLHRISYLLFNNKEQPQNSFLVISPSEQFNRHIEPLLHDLKIPAITLTSLPDYYISILTQYNSRWNEVNGDNRLYNNDYLNTDQLSFMYSSDFLSSIEQQSSLRRERYRNNEREIQRLENERETLLRELKDTKELSKQIELLKRGRRVSLFDQEFLSIFPDDFHVKNRIRPLCKAELFATVLANYYVFGPRKTFPFVFVDEAQDLALSEYTLLTKLNPNAAFNLYGDINQQIHPYCLPSWEALQALSSFVQYDINENYRNTSQITEFINSNLCMRMTALGIEGTDISFISREQIESMVATLESDDRIAFIYNSSARPMIEVGKQIQVLSVEQAKGLEFETVIVFPHNMTANELYVSYSRALNNLYICYNG